MTRSPTPPVKLSPPKLGRVVRRARLFSLLDAAHGHAVWIAAPAGYGKTTLAAGYVGGQSRSAVWYRADAGDGDPAGLFHYLSRAAQRRRGAALPRFGSEYASRLPAFARRFFRAFYARLPGPGIIVIDDVHAAGARFVCDIVEPAIAELPPTHQLIMLSRAFPPTELIAAVARDQLQVVDGAMLAFTPEETRSVAELRLPATLAREHAARLYELTDGWPAALALVCAALDRDPTSIDAVAEHSRDAAFALFGSEVFATLSEDERRFVLLTSLPVHITAATAAAMTGRDDARTMLDSFVSRRMFVNRVASTGAAYRYHDLFREFLQSPAVALAPEAVRDAVDAGVRALTAIGEWDDAIALALDQQMWDCAAQALLQHAPALIGQGRRVTLQEAVRRLPEAWQVRYPMLAYWLGVTHMVADESEACRWFDRAHAQFARIGDRARAQLTAAEAVLAIHMSWHTYVGKDLWLDRLAECGPEPAPTLTARERTRVATARLRAAEMVDDASLDAGETSTVAYDLLGILVERAAEIPVDDRFVAADALQEYASISGRRDVFARAAAAVIPDLNRSDLSPWAKLNWMISFGTIAGRRFAYHPSRLPYASADETLAEAEKLAECEGLQSLEFAAGYSRCALAVACNDLRRLRTQVAHLDRIADARYPMQVSSLMQWKAATAIADDDLPAALEAVGIAVDAGVRGNLPRSQMWSIRLTEAQVLMAAGFNGRAAALMDAEAGRQSGHFSRLCEIVAVTARLREQRDKPDAYARDLGVLVASIRDSGWVNYLSAAPRIAAEIWADALRHGIEVEFVRRAIRARRLTPPDRSAIEWPWMLRVHLLGGFEVEVGGERLVFDGKVQRKPLELLRFVAAHHPAPASTHVAIRALWPAADQRAGKAALDVAVHRLRRLLGDADLLEVVDGVMRFDPNRSWVDAAAIDEWADEAQRRLDAPTDADAPCLAIRLVTSYRGPLFGHEPVPAWAVARREQLHARFVRLAASLGHFHERMGDFDSARAIYEHAVGVEPLAEVLYRGLMRCHGAAGETAEVIRSFRRCREVLSIVLGVAPASETLSLLSRLCEAT